jgi:signal transduction histidine kinase
MARHAEQTRAFVRSRELSQFTADVRTHVYQRLAASAGAVRLPESLSEETWPGFVLDDIDVQIRLSHSDRERLLWTQVREGIAQLARQDSHNGGRDAVEESVQRLERNLRELRNYYDVSQVEAMASSARLGLVGQVATGIACGLAVLLFLIHLIMVRHWLVTPVEVLKSSADNIGRGNLQHRVPLTGNHELAQLARRLDAMAESLATHQAALMEARELSAIGELSAHVAHGLRNPLAAIRASAQLAERRAAGSAETQSMLRDLAAQADRMDHRITRLFQFSKPRELRMGPATFGELALAARAQALPLLDSRGVGLSIEDHTGECVWNLDQEQMSEAIGELVTNAAFHSPTGARVVIRGELLPAVNGEGRRLRIQVIDHGAGMAEATSAKAFDLFFSSRPEGTGMGLALVRRIVERHDGSISLASTPAVGTTVTVILSAVKKGHP